MNEVKPPSKVRQVRSGKGKSEMNGASAPINESQVSANWKKMLLEHPEQVSTSRSDTDFPNKPRPKRSRPKKTQDKNPGMLLEHPDQASTVQNKSQFSNQRRRKKAPEENTETKKELDIWFDDVDESLIEPIAAMASSGKYPNLSSAKSLVAPSGITGITQHVAIDCEMVGAGKDGEDDILARVSIVNQFGHCLYDKYVKPREKVTDYRTRFSGIRPANLKDAEEFDVVQKEVADIIKGKTLVGHALHNDLKVLFLSHPRQRIRDTSRYKPFRKMTGIGGTPSLKRLTEKLLGVNVQQGSHDSVEDAQAAMKLYIMHKIQWEASLKRNKNGPQASSQQCKSQHGNDNKRPDHGVVQKQKSIINNQQTSNEGVKECSKPDHIGVGDDKENAQTGPKETVRKIPTHVAVDCEMVGVGKLGEKNILARVSLVNECGDCLYDKFVKPSEDVTDYRTHISGITPELLQNAEEFTVVQKEVAEIIKGKFLIGHSLHHDLKVLCLAHPRKKTRDTAMYKPFRQMISNKKWQIPSLQILAHKLLGVRFQEGTHDSIEDARMAMQLYTKHKVQWEMWAKRF